MYLLPQDWTAVSVLSLENAVHSRCRDGDGSSGLGSYNDELICGESPNCNTFFLARIAVDYSSALARHGGRRGAIARLVGRVIAAATGRAGGVRIGPAAV